MNAVRQPAVAIDRFGFVLDANPGAEALFGQCLYVKERHLVVVQAKTGLEKLIDKVRETPDTAALPCEPIVIRRSDKAAIFARTLPVPAAARTPFLGARVLLTLTPVEPNPDQTMPYLGACLG